MDPLELSAAFKSLYPTELLQRYQAGEREFQGINLQREQIEAVAARIRFVDTPFLQDGFQRYSYEWRNHLSPLWRDSRVGFEPTFYWWGDEFTGAVDDMDDEVEIPRYDLRDANLAGINLQGAYMFSLDMRGVNLSRARLQGSIWVDVLLGGADLSRADLREARLANNDLTGATLYMARMERSNFTGANLTNIDFRRAKMRKANLTLTTLRGALLQLAYLRRNVLAGANFRGTDLTGIALRGAVVTGALIDPGQEDDFLDALMIDRDPTTEHPWAVFI